MHSNRLLLLAAATLTATFTAAVPPCAAATPQGLALLRALHEADEVRAGSLIGKPADVNSRDDTGATPLMYAAQYGNAGLAAQLLKAGANPNIRMPTGLGPLQIAIENRASTVVELLLQAGADVTVERQSGETPLMSAARTGQLAVMEQLLAHGAPVNNHERKFKQTALMWSAGHPEQVRLLLRHGADPHARTRVWKVNNPIYNYAPNKDPYAYEGDYLSRKGGQNALFFAVQQDDLESAAALIQAGAPVNDRAADGSNALFLSLYKWAAGSTDWDSQRMHHLLFVPNFRIARLLLEHGAEVTIADSAGYTPLHAVALALVPKKLQRQEDFAPGPEPIPARTYEPIDPAGGLALARRLLDLKADPNAVTRYPSAGPVGAASFDPVPAGSSALHIAAMSGNAPLVQLLLERGADPNLLRHDGHSPLSIATRFNDLPSLTLLVAHGGDIMRRYSPTDGLRDPEDIDGVTLLGNKPPQPRTDQTLMHIAAAAGSDKVIDFLARRGAPVDWKNGRGETPLDLARAQEQLRFIVASRRAAAKRLTVTRQSSTSEAIQNVLKPPAAAETASM